MATDKIFNIKYGTKTNLSKKTKIEDGTLYVATKDDNKAELHVDLGSTRYLISEATTVDSALNASSTNPVQNKVVQSAIASNLTEATSYSDGKLTEAKSYSDANLKTAKEYTDTKVAEAKEYADTKSSAALTAAKEDATTKANKTLADAQSYADSAIAAGVADKATKDELTVHINETDGNNKLHITADERTAWTNYETTKAKKSHASTGTEYGKGTDTNYGHIKLSDSSGDFNAASGGTAVTPKALKTLEGVVSQNTAKFANYTTTEDLVDNYATKTEVNNKLDKTSAAESAKKLTVNDTGDTDTPVYFKNGIPVACGTDLDVSIKGSAVSATTASKLGSKTVGSATQPIYLVDGTPTAANDYSTILTEVTSTAEKNLSITAGGTPKEIVDLYATKIATTNKNTINTIAYVMGSIETDTTPVYDTGVYLDTTAGQLTASKFKGQLVGVADSASTLTGLSATITELNYTDGVTSNIQTQLNDKVSKTNSGVQSIAGGLVIGGTTATATEKGRIMVTGNTNPLIGLQAIDADGNQLTPYYFQVADNKMYLGPTSAKALSFDSDGNTTVPATLIVDGAITEGGLTLTAKYALIDHIHDVATETQDGFMSLEDKKKLNGIADEATKIEVDSDLSDSSTNPVENKAIYNRFKNLINGATNTTLKDLEDAIAEGDSAITATMAKTYIPFTGTGDKTVSGDIEMASGAAFVGELEGNARSASALAVEKQVGSTDVPVYIDAEGKPQVTTICAALQDSINTNAEKIKANEDTIAKYGTRISTNEDNIKANADDIAAHAKDIKDLTLDVSKKAPTSHSSADESYGKGTSSKYGHVMLTDISSDSGADVGIAASPKMVKEVENIATANAAKFANYTTTEDLVDNYATKEYADQAEMDALNAAKSHTNDAVTALVGDATKTTLGTVEDYVDSVNEIVTSHTTKLNQLNIAYGTCNTAATENAKIVDLHDDNTNWSLKVGAIVAVKFSNSNDKTSTNVTINVNNTGAHPIWYNNAEYTSYSTSYTGYAGRVTTYMFNGTHWVWLCNSYDSNTTYTNASLGQGYATCATAAATTEKVASLSSYALITGGLVAVKFTNAVPAGATLNINSKGKKAIYYKGAAIKKDVIKAGDVALFIYSSYYHLLAVDTDIEKITTLESNLTALTTKYNSHIADIAGVVAYNADLTDTEVQKNLGHVYLTDTVSTFVYNENIPTNIDTETVVSNSSKKAVTPQGVKDYVDIRIAEVIGGADETVDTLKELANILTTQEGTVGNINAVLATKADAAKVYTKTEIDAFTLSSDSTNYISLKVGDTTTRKLTTLYASHMKNDTNTAKKGYLLVSTGSNTTPFYDSGIYTTTNAGELVIPKIQNNTFLNNTGTANLGTTAIAGTLSVAGATTLSSTLSTTGAATFASTVKIGDGVTLEYNTTKKSLDFIFA